MKETIGFLGAGNMGGALARAVTGAGYEAYCSNRRPEKTAALCAQLGERAHPSDNAAIAETCRLIFLGVKPHMLAALAQDVQPVLAARTDAFCLVSMAAGVTLARLQELFGQETHILRIMPNTPCAVGAGMIPWCAGARADGEDKALLCACLAGAGRLDPLEERLMDAASALSGCGPAFVYQFIEALADGGVRCGLPREKALAYAEQTVLGAGQLALATQKHPGELKDAVCSPGGSTIEGVLTLEDRGLRGAISAAVTAAWLKNQALGRDS